MIVKSIKEQRNGNINLYGCKKQVYYTAGDLLWGFVVMLMHGSTFIFF